MPSFLLDVEPNEISLCLSERSQSATRFFSVVLLLIYLLVLLGRVGNTCCMPKTMDQCVKEWAGMGWTATNSFFTCRAASSYSLKQVGRQFNHEDAASSDMEVERNIWGRLNASTATYLVLLKGKLSKHCLGNCIVETEHFYGKLALVLLVHVHLVSSSVCLFFQQYIF